MSDAIHINHWKNRTCTLCPELVACRQETSQVVVATACPHGGILAIGEAPGDDEDKQGIGFIGEAGIRLRALLNEAGVSEQCYGVANICRCRPYKNRKPYAKEIETCLPYLASLIEECQPKVILAVGGRTAAAVLCGSGTLTSMIAVRESANNWGSRFSRSKYQAIQGALDLVSYVVPMPHTSPRVSNNPNWQRIARNQVSKAVELLRNG